MKGSQGTLSQLGYYKKRKEGSYFLLRKKKKKGRSEEEGQKEGGEEGKEGRMKGQKEQPRVQKTVLEQMLPARHSLALFLALTSCKHLVLFKCQAPHQAWELPDK